MATTGFGRGRRVSLVDGCTASMPDTRRRTSEPFPRRPLKASGLSSPSIRMAMIISPCRRCSRHGNGAVQRKGTGEPSPVASPCSIVWQPMKSCSETAIFRLVFHCMLESLMQREVDGLFRMYQGRKFDFRRGRRLGVEDHLVTWAKPKRPDWMDEETYAQIPDEMTVRELRFKVEQPGFRVDNVVLVTTMLDATMYTKDELADLYLQRWNVELDLRSIKDVLQMDVLRCKSPEMVEKEIWMHLLAYNLIQSVPA